MEVEREVLGRARRVRGGAVVVRVGGETDDELVRAKSETRTVSTFLSLIVVKAM